MSAIKQNLIKRVSVKSKDDNSTVKGSRTYRGLSTVDSEKTNATIYDLELIKQDIINHFHIRQGEKLENPTFGTIIWDVLYDPLTPQLKELIGDNVIQIINSDPRIVASQVGVNEFEHGLRIECDLTYLPYNISEKMQLTFDKNNGFLS